MSATLRDGFNAIFGDTAGDAGNLGHRVHHITNAVIDKISRYRTQPASVEEWLLDRRAERLRDIPVEDFDQLQAELAKFIKKNGCCTVTVKGDQYRLSELAIQMESAAELLAPYRPLLKQ